MNLKSTNFGSKSRLSRSQFSHLTILLRTVENVLLGVFFNFYHEMELKWQKLSFDQKNVSKAGEITREIDANSKKYLKIFKMPKSVKPSKSDHVDIDVIKF